MSQGRSVFWNPHERITSNDLNLMGTVAAALSLKLNQSLWLSSALDFSAPSAGAWPSLVAGFSVQYPTVANTISLQRQGAIMQFSTSFPAIPALDSANGNQSYWRFADLLDSSTAVSFTFPVEAQHRWVIIEARIEDATDLTAVRDIRDTGTHLFAPQVVVVQKGYQVVFRTRTSVLNATDAPAPVAGWVPIALCRTVAGGGVISDSTVWDLRMRPTDVVDGNRSQGISGSSTSAFRADCARGSHNIIVRGSGVVSLETNEPAMLNGIALAAQQQPFALTPSDFATTAVAAGDWYWYLALPGGLPVRQMSKPESQGILVLAPTPPSASTVSQNKNVWMNNAAFTMPAPFVNFSAVVNASNAIFIGHTRRNAANSAWVPMSQTGHHVEISGDEFLFSVANPAGGAVNVALTLTAMPWMRNIRVQSLFLSADRVYARGIRTRLGSPEYVTWSAPVNNQPALTTFWHCTIDNPNVQFSTLDALPAGGATSFDFRLDAYDW